MVVDRPTKNQTDLISWTDYIEMINYYIYLDLEKEKEKDDDQTEFIQP